MAQILGTNPSSVNQTASILNAAAAKYGVPATTLFGVWGIETNFGQNVKTSSAGAVGDFQFLPSTAAGYGYPLTNTPTFPQFTQQADAAAHYLSDLFHRTGSWDAALKAYSGGGYGLAQVQAKAGAGPGNNLGGINVPGLSSINPAGGLAPNVSTPNIDIGSVISGVWQWLTTPAKWVRILEYVGGAVLIYMGIKGLTGLGPDLGDIAAVAAKAPK